MINTFIIFTIRNKKKEQKRRTLSLLIHPDNLLVAINNKRSSLPTQLRITLPIHFPTFIHFKHTLCRLKVTFLPVRSSSPLSYPAGSAWHIAVAHSSASSVADRMQSTRPSLKRRVEALSYVHTNLLYIR